MVVVVVEDGKRSVHGVGGNMVYHSKGGVGRVVAEGQVVGVGVPRDLKTVGWWGDG